MLTFILFSVIIFSFLIGESYAHQDGCHGWHSCPSDSGSYTCGDKGYCSECTDNAYCKDRQVRGIEPIQSFERSNSVDVESTSNYDYLRIGVVVFFAGLIVIVFISKVSNRNQKK